MSELVVTTGPATLLVDFGGPRRVLSSGLLGGGLGEACGWLNVTVERNYSRPDPRGDLIARAAALGFARPLVGMMTAVDVARVERVRHGVATAFATVGIGHPLAAAGSVERIVPAVGTINVLVVVDEPLDDAALAGAAQTAVEAKVQAIAAVGIRALNADCHATGTATDSFCIAALPGGGVPYAGPVTTVGADIAQAVHAAVLAGARADRADFGPLYEAYRRDPARAAAKGGPDTSATNGARASRTAAVVAALAPRPGELLWDVGAGSGSVAIGWLRSPAALTERPVRAIAFEADRDRAATIAAGAHAFGVPQLTVVEGRAPASFADPLVRNGAPDAVFVGGGMMVPGLLEGAWHALRPGGRIVVDAETYEQQARLTQARAKHGGTLTPLAHDHADGTATARPAPPAVRWEARKPG